MKKSVLMMIIFCFYTKKIPESGLSAGKNTHGEITNEAVRSSSPLGQLLESKNADEVAAIESELILGKAESYLLDTHTSLQARL